MRNQSFQARSKLHNLKRSAFLIAIATTLFLLKPSLSLASGITASGQTVSFYIPVSNNPRNRSPLINVQLFVDSAPIWLSALPTSIAGPVTIYPGQTMPLRMDFKSNNLFNPNQLQAEVDIEIKSNNQNLNAPRFIWQHRTSNAFETMSSELLDGVGQSFGDSISPDTFPPNSSLFFIGPSFTNVSDNLFISTQTETGIQAVDQQVPDSVVSGVAFTGFLLDLPASNITQLKPFISTFTLAEGNHFIVYASSDNAGNVEALNISSIAVDGTPPISNLSIGQPQFALSTTTLLVSAITPFVIASTDRSRVASPRALEIRSSALMDRASRFYRVRSRSRRPMD